MKNLPVQSMLKNCKIFAVASVLSLCVACGGSQPSDTPGGDASASPISGEVEIKGDEVNTSSGEATAEENKTEKTSEVATSAPSEGSSEKTEVADNSDASQPQENAVKKEQEPVRKNLAVAKVRDPFDKYYGPPAIGTSLTGGVRPSTDKGNKGLNSAYKRKLAAQKAKDVPKTVIKVNKPDVKVTGILRSGSNYNAILQGPEKAIMVSTGQNISGYRVAAVTSQDVTLVYKDKYKFVIPLEKEVFGSTGNPDATAGKMTTNNDAIKAPVIEKITK